MQKNLTIILIVLLIVMIAVMLYAVYLLNQSQLILQQEITNLKNQVNQPLEQSTEQEKAKNGLEQPTSYQPVNVRYNVKMKADDQNQKMGFIVQNNFTGDSDTFISLDQGTNIYDQAEFVADNLFVSLVDTFGEYQIWRFDENKNKSVIFKSRQDLFFVVDQSANNLALIGDQEKNESEFIRIIDAKTGESKNITFSADQFDFVSGDIIRQAEFEYNSPNLWLLVNSPFEPRVVYSVNINNTEINEYDASVAGIDSQLMPSRDLLLFTDSPWFQDPPRQETLEKMKSQDFHVYALDLISQEKELLATKKGDWDIRITIMDNNTFKFDDETYRFDYLNNYYNWRTESHGPGLEYGVIDTYTDDYGKRVINMNSTAGGNYYLEKAYYLPIESISDLDNIITWDWQQTNIDRPYGLVSVGVMFLNDNVKFSRAQHKYLENIIGVYELRHHTGDFDKYNCSSLMAENDLAKKNSFACEEKIGQEFKWQTEIINFKELLDNQLIGVDKSQIKSIKILIVSYNNAGSGANASWRQFTIK